jgi:hypothetical protein
MFISFRMSRVTTVFEICKCTDVENVEYERGGPLAKTREWSAILCDVLTGDVVNDKLSSFHVPVS